MICALSSESSPLRIIVFIWSAAGTCIPSTSVLCTQNGFESWKCHRSTSKHYVWSSVLPATVHCWGLSFRKEGPVIPLQGFQWGGVWQLGLFYVPLTQCGQTPVDSAARGESPSSENKEIWWLPLVLCWFKGNGGAMLIIQLVLLRWT